MTTGRWRSEKTQYPEIDLRRVVFDRTGETCYWLVDEATDYQERIGEEPPTAEEIAAFRRDAIAAARQRAEHETD